MRPPEEAEEGAPPPTGSPPAVGSGVTSKAQARHVNYSDPLPWASAARPKLRHLHLHVAVHVRGQGGPVKDEVVHHHVEGQSGPPVRNGLVQGTRRLLLGLDLLLTMSADSAGKGWEGRGPAGLGRGCGTLKEPASREHSPRQARGGNPGGPRPDPHSPPPAHSRSERPAVPEHVVLDLTDSCPGPPARAGVLGPQPEWRPREGQALEQEREARAV